MHTRRIEDLLPTAIRQRRKASLRPAEVGNTHLAIGLGRKAIMAGYSTLFAPATALIAPLAKYKLWVRTPRWQDLASSIFPEQAALSPLVGH